MALAALLAGTCACATAGPPDGVRVAPIDLAGLPGYRLAADSAPLKVALLRAAETTHPHRNIASELSWLTNLARAGGRKVEIQTVSRADELVTELATGKADLVIGDLPPGEIDRDDIVSSESFHHVRYRLVGPSESRVGSPLELAGKRIALPLSSPLWPYFERLERTLDDVYLAALPEYLSQDAILAKLSAREYDYTVLAFDNGDDALEPFPSLAWQFDLTPTLPVAFHARADAGPLLEAVNRRLKREPLYPSVKLAHIRDLDRIRESGVLRVITQPNGRNFYLERGRPSGFEFHVVRHFAANLGVRPEFLLADSEREMLDWLKAGVGDVVTMPLPETTLHGDPAVATSRDYHYVAPTVITAGPPIVTLEALSGRRVAAEAGTVPYRALVEFARSRPELGLSVIKLSTPLPAGDAVRALKTAEVDAIVVDGVRLDALAERFEGLHAGVTLPSVQRFRWAFRTRDDQLAERVERFMTRAYQRGTYRTATTRYFNHDQPAQYDSLTPFDDLLKEYAGRYQFDWRLLAAVMYQESQFDAGARSPDGARGLMQVMPQTAAELGFDSVDDPEASVHAGAKYLATIRDRFDRRLPLRERTWFALAGYNAGPARVDQARSLATEMGLDPDVWFGNVELAMSRLGQPVHRRLAEHNPPCWCDEPVDYVRNVSRYYDNYRTFSRIAQMRGAAVTPLAALTPQEDGTTAIR